MATAVASAAFARPSRQIAKEISKAKSAELRKKGLAAELTDYYGKPIAEPMYEYLVADVEQVKKFFARAAAAGHFILAAAQ